MRLVLTSVILLLIGAILVQMVAEMPGFGQAGPAVNEVTRHYQDHSLKETGATNIISAIILDYRAYDTLGEATVLFAGIAAVLATLASHRGKEGG